MPSLIYQKAKADNAKNPKGKARGSRDANKDLQGKKWTKL
jgi:hypothetical protein